MTFVPFSVERVGPNLLFTLFEGLCPFPILSLGISKYKDSSRKYYIDVLVSWVRPEFGLSFHESLACLCVEVSPLSMFQGLRRFWSHRSRTTVKVSDRRPLNIERAPGPTTTVTTVTRLFTLPSGPWGYVGVLFRVVTSTSDDTLVPGPFDVTDVDGRTRWGQLYPEWKGLPSGCRVDGDGCGLVRRTPDTW